MNDSPTHFRARAEAEQAAADASRLDNVRERCERSAKAWSKMADQAERTLALRRSREAATAAKVDLVVAQDADIEDDRPQAVVDLPEREIKFPST